MSARVPPELLRAAWIGSRQRREFLPAWELLSVRTRLEHVRDPRRLDRYFSSPGATPKIVILAATRPGEFATPRMEALRQAAPLSRLLMLLGPWCDGALRTDPPPAGITLISWHRATAWLSRELARWADGAATSWSLPATATPEDRILAEAAWSKPSATRHASVGIVARELSVADALVRACRWCGYPATWLPHAAICVGPAPDVVLWDLEHGVPEEETIADIRSSWADVPLIALKGFPRPEDLATLNAHGVVALLGKPYRLDDLRALLEHHASA